MKKIFLPSLFIGGISFTFPSFVQAVGGERPQPQPVFATRTASEQEPGQHPQRASTPAVDMRQIDQILYALNDLRTDPHAHDRQVPQMATTLCRAFREQYPQSRLPSYEEAKRSFLAAATDAGVIPAGSHGAGISFIDLFNRRFNAIPQGPLLNATQQILPVSVLLAEIVGERGMRALVDQSVQQDGTDSALYGAFLLHASSTLSSLMAERMRAQNAAAEAAASSPYPLGAGGGAELGALSEGEELSLTLAISRRDLLERMRAQNAAAEAAGFSPYPLGAGGGAELGSLSEGEELSLALAISRDLPERMRAQNAAEAVAVVQSNPTQNDGLRRTNYEKMCRLLSKNGFQAENSFIKERLSESLSSPQYSGNFSPKGAFLDFITSLMIQIIDNPNLLKLPPSLCQFAPQEVESKFRRMESDAKLAAESLGFDPGSNTFKNCFFKSALKLFLKEYSETFLTSTYGFSYGKKMFQTLQSFETGVKSAQNRHPLDPLTKQMFPHIFGFFIGEEGFNRSHSRTWSQSNRSKDHVLRILLSWFDERETPQMTRARENLTENFLQKQSNDRTQEPSRIPSETLDGFDFISLSSGARVEGGQDQYYPSAGLRLSTQVPYLKFMNELINFVEALPNEEIKNAVKRNILMVFESQISQGDLGIPRFVHLLLNIPFSLEDHSFTDDQVREAFAVARTNPLQAPSASPYEPILTDRERRLQSWERIQSFPIESFTQSHASDFFANPDNIREIKLLNVELGTFQWNQSSFLEASIAQEVQNLFSFEEVPPTSQTPEETVARIITDENFRDRSLTMRSWSSKKTNFQKMLLWTDYLSPSEKEPLLGRINDLAVAHGANCPDAVLTGWNAIELEILQKRSGLSERNFLLTLIYTNFHEALESHLAQFDFREMIETSLQIKHLLNSEAKIPFFTPVIGNYFSHYYLDSAIEAAGVRGAELQPNGILTALWQRFSNPLAFIMTQAANEANQSVLEGLDTMTRYEALLQRLIREEYERPLFPPGTGVFEDVAGQNMGQMRRSMYEYVLFKLLEKYRFIERVS